MNVYVDNIFTMAESVTAANMAAGYASSALYDEVLSNNLVFNDTSTIITAAWGLNHFADTVAVLDSNWTIGRLTVYSQGAAVFDSGISSRGKHTIIQLPDLFMVSGITLELHSTKPLEIGILFAGPCVKLPLFNIGFKYALNVTSKAERTRYGIVYGMKTPPLRSFEVSFTGIDNETREKMEAYIEEVQYIQPHLVAPYDADCFQPLYASLTGAGGFLKRDEPGFRWDTALTYMEAK